MQQNDPDFWNKHSIEYLKMAYDYNHRERLTHPDGYGKNVGDCGDTVEYFLTFKEDKLINVAFDTDGCINTTACANTIIQIVEGQSIEEVWEVSPEDVIAYLKTLPESSHHCAELAVGALYKAVSDYEKKQNN